MWIDVLIVAVFAINLVLGYKKGFLTTVINLLSWIAAIAVAYFSLDYVVGWLDGYLNLDALGTISKGITFIVIAIIIKIIFNVLANIFRGVNKIPLIGSVNRILGAGAGLIRAIIIIWIVGLVLIPALQYTGPTEMPSPDQAQSNSDMSEKLSETYSASKLIEPCMIQYNPLLNIVDFKEEE